ncbi:unnamed protein product [Prunus armeniaca]
MDMFAERSPLPPFWDLHPFYKSWEASMDMWLCMKRAIMTAERAKMAYEDGRSKGAEASKVL